MGQLGIGAMLHLLCGGSEKSSSDYEGAVIKSAALVDDRIQIAFDDGRAIEVWDNGQSCCESRYITTDDDPASLVGGKLVAITAKDGPNADAEYDEHEICFVEIQTDKGFVTFTTHNEHNGYYGGFGLTITETASLPGPQP